MATTLHSRDRHRPRRRPGQPRRTAAGLLRPPDDWRTDPLRPARRGDHPRRARSPSTEAELERGAVPGRHPARRLRLGTQRRSSRSVRWPGRRRRVRPRQPRADRRPQRAGRRLLPGRLPRLLGPDLPHRTARRHRPDRRPRESAPATRPARWTALTDHLRRHGATDEELLAAGLAKQASTGRLIDTFRDRLILPIHTTVRGMPTAGHPMHEQRGPALQVVGFVGRRHPDHDDARAAAPTPPPRPARST